VTTMRLHAPLAVRAVPDAANYLPIVFVKAVPVPPFLQYHCSKSIQENLSKNSSISLFVRGILYEILILSMLRLRSAMSRCSTISSAGALP